MDLPSAKGLQIRHKQMGLLENALSLRTSAHAGVVPQGYFLRAQSPGFSNILAVKPSCFHPTGGLPHHCDRSHVHSATGEAGS